MLVITADDFNAGTIDWTNNTVPSSAYQCLMCQKLLNVLSVHDLSQQQPEASRGEKMLDLFCTNKRSLTKFICIIPALGWEYTFVECFPLQFDWHIFVSHDIFQLTECTPSLADSPFHFLYLVMVLSHHLPKIYISVDLLNLLSIDNNNNNNLTCMALTIHKHDLQRFDNRSKYIT